MGYDLDIAQYQTLMGELDTALKLECFTDIKKTCADIVTLLDSLVAERAITVGLSNNLKLNSMATINKAFGLQYF